MGLSFTRYVEENFHDQIIEAAEAAVEETNYREIPTHVTKALVWQIDLNKLYTFEDYAELPIIIAVTVKSNDDGSDYYNKLYMRGIMSGTFSKGLCDFRIKLKKVLKREPRRIEMKVTDDLLLKSHTKEFENEVSKLIAKAYPHLGYDKLPHEIDPVLIAKKYGFTVVYAPLGPKDKVRGAFTRAKTAVNLYDDTANTYYAAVIEAMTIMVNKALYGNWEVVRFTVAHELIHAIVQRFAFWFKRICDKIDSPFCCPYRTFEDYRFLDDFVERTERQADYGASLELMPRTAFRVKAQEILEKYGENPDPYDFRDAVEETAKFFVVSISAAKRTFNEENFEGIAGVFNFIDGDYVRPFGYKKGSLAKDETFVISAEQLRTILADNKKLTKHFTKGRLCFIENHLVVNIPKFIEGHAGGRKLTWEARTHMDQCAVKFKLVFADSRVNYRLQTDNTEVMYRAASTLREVHVIMADDKLSELEKYMQLADRTEDITSITKKMGNDFAASMEAVVQWSDMDRGEICEKAWIDRKTLYNLCNNDKDKPTLKIMVRLCLSMQLPMEVSIMLIECSRCGTRATLTDMGFLQFIACPTLFTVKSANYILTQQGRDTLGGHEPGL